MMADLEEGRTKQRKFPYAGKRDGFIIQRWKVWPFLEKETFCCNREKIDANRK